jgi:hypothetical protein
MVFCGRTHFEDTRCVTSDQSDAGSVDALAKRRRQGMEFSKQGLLDDFEQTLVSLRQLSCEYFSHSVGPSCD